jgi:hypothetical protein
MGYLCGPHQVIHAAKACFAFYPDTGLVFDVDAQAAYATRKRPFNRAACDALKVVGAHMDFPGFDMIVRGACRLSLRAPHAGGVIGAAQPRSIPPNRGA